MMSLRNSTNFKMTVLLLIVGLVPLFIVFAIASHQAEKTIVDQA